MQAQMQQFQEEMKHLEITASAGGELVKVTMNGEKKVQKIEIHPDCVDREDIEGLEDLLLEAFNAASAIVDEKSSQKPEMF